MNFLHIIPICENIVHLLLYFAPVSSCFIADYKHAVEHGRICHYVAYSNVLLPVFTFRSSHTYSVENMTGTSEHNQTFNVPMKINSKSISLPKLIFYNYPKNFANLELITMFFLYLK